MSEVSRRHFMQRALSVSAGFAGLRVGYESNAFASVAARLGAGLGPLVPDPEGVIDLPEGFTYSILSRAGERMDDGLRVPGMHDGMATFAGPDGLTLIVRNHEMEKGHSPSAFDDGLRGVRPEQIYDTGHGHPSKGGTTTLVYDTARRRLVRHFLSLAGTERNCAGGLTPRGTWITCEETVVRAGERHERDHGWCFEVPASVEPGLAEPRPIYGMGRFNHEACATDPRTGVVYLTEDRGDGLLYRYVPRDPGDLHAGGRLEALAVRGQSSLDTRNWGATPTMRRGEPVECEWVELEGVDAPEDDLRLRGFRAGAARFARGEGMWWGDDSAYFACTNGGPKKLGQLFRLRPGVGGRADTLELFIESTDPAVLEYADNICTAPWGDIIVCEDGTGDDRLIGVTPGGELYTIARNALNNSEFAGSTFSPDGTTLFVNMQSPGFTLAITGPWAGG